jgi:hypothetical protein
MATGATAVESKWPFDRGQLIEVCRRHGVTKVALFGSMVRGEQTAESDIDLLVEFSQGKSLWALVRLERELAQALGRKVDVLTEAALSPYLRPLILQEMKVIYEA